VGVVVGNNITDMTVYSEKEVDNENSTIYEKTESLHLGVSLTTASFMQQNSKLLSMTLEEHLTSLGKYEQPN